MAALLDSLPEGSDIFLDTNVMVYGLTGVSEQCKSLLERCSREEVFGATLVRGPARCDSQVHDRREAQEKGFFVGEQDKGPKYLAKHPEKVKLLTDYWVNTLRLLALNLLPLPMEHSIVRGAQSERINAGLLTTDSLIVAAMRAYGIAKIATSDRLFDSVAGITVFAPTDLAN